MLKKITKEIRDSLEDSASYIAKHSNVNKYGFSPSMITDVFVHLYKKTDGKFDPNKTVFFATDYKNTLDENYYEVNALINLMKKYLPKEMVVAKTRTGMKLFIAGTAADEIFPKLLIRWADAHLTTAGAKIPIVLPTCKLKCFGGEKIQDEIKRIKNRNGVGVKKGKVK